MAVATVGAIAVALYENGDYTEAIAVMLFYQIGELFQSYAVGKSRKNISELMDIRPDYANIEVDGKLTQVDPDEVAIGSVIVVQPGEKVPIDGVIVEGSSTLNTSALTCSSAWPRPRPAASAVANWRTGCTRQPATTCSGATSRAPGATAAPGRRRAPAARPPRLSWPVPGFADLD